MTRNRDSGQQHSEQEAEGRKKKEGGKFYVSVGAIMLSFPLEVPSMALCFREEVPSSTDNSRVDKQSRMRSQSSFDNIILVFVVCDHYQKETHCASF